MQTKVKNSVKSEAVKVATTTKVATKAKVSTKTVASKKDLPLTKVVSKTEVKNSTHKVLMIANKAFKENNLSLSGAIKNYRKFAIESGLMNDFVNSELIENCLTFDNILANVNAKCIETKRFSLWFIGLAVNKQLKKQGVTI
jgi:hypothetical protein